MMTLKQGSKVKFNTSERFPGLDFLQIVFTSQTSRSNCKGDIRPFIRITPFDIKRDMAAILFWKLDQNYYQTSFPSHISFVQI